MCSSTTSSPGTALTRTLSLPAPRRADTRTESFTRPGTPLVLASSPPAPRLTWRWPGMMKVIAAGVLGWGMRGLSSKER